MVKALFGAAALLIVLAIVAAIGLRQTHSVALVPLKPAASGVPSGSAHDEARAVQQEVVQQIGQAMGAASASRSQAEGPP